MKLGVLAAHELQDQVEPAADLPVRWWTPFTCGRAGVLRVGEVRRPGRCGSRGCVECHQRKLRRTMDAVKVLRRRPGERMYSVVLAPPPVATRGDVAAFLGSVRALFREWEQKHGLGAVWWVAEVVRKPEWDRTCIPCPLRAYTPADYGVGEWWADDLVEEVEGVQAACRSGSCKLCDGTGWLPGVHLHVHAAVMAEPFWFGDGEAPPPPPGARRWRDFGGLGWNGYLAKHGLSQADKKGFGGVEVMRSKNGLAAYISKACLVYLAKTGDGKRQVDHDATQLGAELAAAVYGRRRHREKGGRAYGLGRRTRDAAVRTAFEPGDLGQPSPAKLAREGGRAEAVEAAKRDQAVRQAVGEDGPPPVSAPVELLQLGRRNAARGDYGPAAAAVAGAEERQARWADRAVQDARRADWRVELAERQAARAEDCAARWARSAKLNLDRADRARSDRTRRRYLGRAERAAERAARLDGQWSARARRNAERADAAERRAQHAAQRAEEYRQALTLRETHGVLRRTEVAEPRGTAKRGQVRSRDQGSRHRAEPWQPEVTRWTEAGPQPAKRLHGAHAVAGDWHGVPFVGADEWWTAPHPKGVVVGRGEVCTFLPADAWGQAGQPEAASLVEFAQGVQLAAELVKNLDAYPDLAGCEPGELFPFGVELDWCEALDELAARSGLDLPTE